MSKNLQRNRASRRAVRLKPAHETPIQKQAEPLAFHRGPGRLFYFKDYGAGKDQELSQLRLKNFGGPVDWNEMLAASGKQTVAPVSKEILDNLLPRCDALAREVGGMIVVQENIIAELVSIELYAPYLFFDSAQDETLLRDLARHAELFLIDPHEGGIKVDIGLPYYQRIDKPAVMG